MDALSVIQTLDVYVISLFLLVVIGMKAWSNPNGKLPQTRAFSALLALNFCIIIADAITVIFDGRPGVPMRIVLMGTSVFGFCLQVVICFSWYWYARTIVFSDRKLIGVADIIGAIPAVVCIGVAVSSCWTGWFFRYDAQNVYHRGRFFALEAVSSYLYILFGYYMIIRHRKKIDRRYLVALLSFALPPLIAGMIQFFVYGVSLIWSSTTISLLIIYLAIQHELLLLDFHTGLNNRRSFDEELRRRVANAKESSTFALLLVDIDNFRSINDRYGHIECDKLLQDFAKLLNDCFHRGSFVARYGGDEFAVIVNIWRLRDTETLRQLLDAKIDEWNATSGKKWKLSVSVGCAPYIPSDKLSADHFIMKVDRLLSLDKIVPGERRFVKRRSL